MAWILEMRKKKTGRLSAKEVKKKKGESSFIPLGGKGNKRGSK